MVNYTLVDQNGVPQNLIVVDDPEEYPLPEGWTLQDPSVWDKANTPVE